MIVFFREVGSLLETEASRPSSRRPFKIERCQKQHAALQKAVRDLGHEVELIPPAPESPTGVFVSDEALLLSEVAVVPRSEQPRADLDSISRVLAQHRPVQRISEGETFSGSDVLPIGHTLYATLSPRTNAEGIAILREITRPFGYDVKTVEVRGEVSLREACSFIPPRFLLINAEWIDPDAFEDLSVIHVAPDEPAGAPTLTLADTTLVSASFPETEKRLRAAGIATRKVDISELEKAGGHLARLALVKEPRTVRPAPVEHGSALKVVETPQVPSSGKAAHAIIHGGLAYVSAQLPFDPNAPDVPKLSPEEQTERVLRNVAAVLHAAGSSLSDVLHATVHLADPKHLERIEATYERVFAGHRPTRSVISNRALPAGVLVEIEVVAAVTKRTSI
ncbi:endoribonuclease L-PSP [Opitutaceae bacterium TAV5]|nr:endoribonuclease L-PSP [Opitutaceae bacterium TAV5]